MVNDRRLFQPLKLGRSQLENRVALAPLTRFRAPNHLPTDLHATYYAQRASKGGGLLITEATFISAEAGGYGAAPGIYSKEQISAWKKVTDAVHEKNGVIYMQLWAIGRANPGTEDDAKRVVSASDLPIEENDEKKPEPMTLEDIKRYVGDYKQAALNAVEAGFDGVEIHSANGYLLQQFIEESSNKRTDNYGGSLENRTRFTKEVIEAISSAIGEDRTGIRLSPWTTFQGMGQSKDAYTTYLHICNHIKSSYPKFSYVHIVEDDEAWRGAAKENIHRRSNDPFRSVFRSPVEGKKTQEEGEAYPDPDENSPTVFITCSDFKTEKALKHTDAKGDVVAIGRPFIANPDLPERIRNNWEFTPYNRDTFYAPGSVGYTDYAVYGERGHGEEAAEQKKAQENKAKLA